VLVHKMSLCVDEMCRYETTRSLTDLSFSVNYYT